MSYGSISVSTIIPGILEKGKGVKPLGLNLADILSASDTIFLVSILRFLKQLQALLAH
jgi:hypothetical protein